MHQIKKVVLLWRSAMQSYLIDAGFLRLYIDESSLVFCTTNLLRAENMPVEMSLIDVFLHLLPQVAIFMRQALH